ncbi:MAG: O-antigen ligase family protein [Pseudomonadota bacterium]|nr:O-antigen ligase family protein [Pseudomonadota bacterium]
MNSPLAFGIKRGRARTAPAAHGQGGVTDARGSLFVALMVWVLIVYLVVPATYLRGETNLLADAGTAAAANPVGRTIKLTLLFFSTVIVLWRARLVWFVCRSINPFFVAFLALVPLSVVWSIDPGATLARYVSLLSIVQVCLAFTLVAWNRTRFQDVVRPVVTALLIASVLWGLFYPEYGIEAGEKELKDAWRGLTTQKNQFGMLASFGAVLWLHAWLNNEKKWWLALPLFGLSCVCVLLSRSSTSLLATALCTLFMLLVMAAPANLRRYMPYIVSSFAVLVVIYALAILNLIPGISLLLEPIAALAGKDLTFSNRAVIWDIIKEHIQLAPFLGSGYGAYWTGPYPSSPSYAFLVRMFFYPSEAHNGYLEMVNDLGFIGLICLLGYLVYWVRQSLELMKLDRGQGLLFLALFFQQAITNLSETTWLAINSAFAIVVMTLAMFSLARSLLEWRVLRHFRAPVAEPQRHAPPRRRFQ